MQPTILITGATGFLGAHVALELLQSGYHVKGTFRNQASQAKAKQIFGYYENGFSLFDKVEWVSVDMLDYSEVLMAMQGVQYVVHTAAEVSFNPQFKNRIIENNTLMASYVVDAAIEAGVKKLCHISSIAALGSTINGEPITEETKLASVKDQSAYSTSKFYAEMEVWRAINSGLNAVILNPSVILGAGDWKTSSSTFISSIAKGLSFYSKGVTGFVDVRDVARASRLALESDISAERFILSSENINYYDLFCSIAKGLSKPVPRYKAYPFLIKAIAAFSGFYSYITGKEPLVTPQSARSAWRKSYYSGKKFETQFNFKYTPISETVDFACTGYLNSNRKK
ncbi:NAD-dependent epimerase/dehydratase family protein [uncultured Acetobacteroides sp.]|uniref:NAD-dependent epimerase/dehydratase family protein n=1 Tax=uncultured Acetobacteroides sp. TaxID=1760811 RepID=UPI0029F4AD62|nr:NAD-dependent epimerase/dehydratase family protein [uncultured Acetobacteroides sp.]